MPATIYSEIHFLIALEVIKSRPRLAAAIGEETLAVIKDALVIAANEAAIDEGDPDPGSADVLVLGG